MHIRAAVATGLFVSISLLPSAATSQDAARRRSLPRHFTERPPIHLEFEPEAKPGPRVIVTNLHQEPLTAFLVQTEPTTDGLPAQVLPWDAYEGGFSPIPRGLSLIQGVPRVMGGETPNVRLLAAVWEDGSTYGLDEHLERIRANREVIGEAFDRALSLLQAGLREGWTREQYLAAVDRELKPQGPNPRLSPNDVERATRIVSLLVSGNLQGGMRVDGQPARLEFAVQKLIEICRQRRDTLKPSPPN